MIKPLIPRSAVLICGAVALCASIAFIAQAESLAPQYPPTPTQIVADSPASEWVSIAPSDLMVMQLSPDAKGRERRVVIQLMSAPFSQGWVGNIRTLAAAQFWDGLSIYRVQDNYVTQWGDADGEDASKAKALPDGLAVVPESDYAVAVNRLDQEKAEATIASSDPYGMTIFYDGWPLNLWPDDGNSGEGQPDAGHGGGDGGASERGVFAAVSPTHCYGMVGVARDLSPSTGTGAELYVVIGHAPRHLDRNIALVGRVIEGMEHLSSLPRGTGAMGFYENADERTPIVSVRMGDGVDDLPVYEYLRTGGDSFAAFSNARANRQDAFFIRPAGGADICNIPVPVRRKPV